MLWAHNGHIANSPGWMGSYLKREFGDEAYLIGFEFDHGAFTSRAAVVHTYSVAPASPAYYAHALAKLDAPLLFLDCATLARKPVARDWLQQGRRSHDFAELYAVFRLWPQWHTQYTPWPDRYDGVIFVEESTPAIGLR